MRAARIENSASRTRSDVGRVAAPGGAFSGRPRQSPAITRIQPANSKATSPSANGSPGPVRTTRRTPGGPSGCRRSGESGASGRRDQSFPPVPTCDLGDGAAPSPARGAPGRGVERVLGDHGHRSAGLAGGGFRQRRDPHGQAGGGLGEAVHRARRLRARRYGERVGQQPPDLHRAPTAADVRSAPEGAEVGKPSRAQLGGGLPQRNISREAEPIAERPRRRRRADPQHLDVHARPHDPAEKATRPGRLHEHRRAGPPRQLRQRHAGIRSTNDQIDPAATRTPPT